MEGFGKSQFPYMSTKVSRSDRPICFSANEYSSHTVPFGGMRHVSGNYFLARKVRADQRLVEMVGPRGGQPESSARYTSTGLLTSS
jgi:hypothetical protein